MALKAQDYEAARNDWMGGNWDISNQQAAQDSAKSWANKWGANYLGGDSVDLYGDGGQMDIIHNLKSGQNMLRGWTATAQAGGQPMPQAAPAAAPAAAVAPAAPARDPQWDALYGQLMGRAQQGLAVDKNDPAIRAQADAFAAQQERSRRNFLGDIAEKGGPYNAGEMLGQQRMTAERAGQAAGGFEANLVGQEIKARRDEIAQALQSMQGMLTAEQQMSMQKELARLDDATRRYTADASAASSRYSTDASRYAADQQAGIARDRLGYDYAQGDNQMLQQLLNQLGR